MTCSIARSLAVAGGPWSPLVLRDVGVGIKRFDDIQRDLGVLMVMAAWGDRWTAGVAGPPVVRRHRACGQITQVEMHCAACGEILESADVDVEPGPGLATRHQRRRP